MSPPWIFGHLSRSNLTKLIKLDKEIIPCAVIKLFLLKFRVVNFDRPTNLENNDTNQVVDFKYIS